MAYRRRITLCLLLLLGVMPAAATATPKLPPPVRVDGGLIQGSKSGDITVYKGIPFAAPPVGPLRWKPPQPVLPWHGVKRTVAYAPACAQVPSGVAMKLTTSEDCLYLNIWTPAHKPGAHLPVMVWIYGGGFELGWTSMPVYDGRSLAKKGVIVVSIAYRVGPLGFLATPALTAESPHHASGDYGLLDQIAGLKWVQRNIAHFGGDPAKVTIFGESAGGMSVNILAASPLAKGLFARAISESGGAMTPPRRANEGGQEVPTLHRAEIIGRKFLKSLGVRTMAAARALPAERIVDAPGAGLTGNDTGMIGGNFWAVADGYVLPANMCAVYAAGRQNDTPVLIGVNSDEGQIFPHPRTARAFRRYVHAKFGPFAKAILAAYPAGSDRQAEAAAAALTGDAVIVWPSWAWARLQSRTGRGKVFVYVFTRHAAPAGSPARGALHGDEIPYVFDNLDAMPGRSYTGMDRRLANTVSAYWTNFAKTGNPNGKGLPQWPVFSPGMSSVMRLGRRLGVMEMPELNRLRVLSRYFAWRRGQAHSACLEAR